MKGGKLTRKNSIATVIFVFLLSAATGAFAIQAGASGPWPNHSGTAGGGAGACVGTIKHERFAATGLDIFQSASLQQSSNQCDTYGARVKYLNSSGNYRWTGWSWNDNYAYSAVNGVISPYSNHYLCTSSCSWFSY